LANQYIITITASRVEGSATKLTWALPVSKPTLAISYTFIAHNHNKIDLQADFYILADPQINLIDLLF